MDKIDQVMFTILERYEQMSPEEFINHIKKSMKNPLYKMLKQFNDETIEALKEIESENKE